MITLCALGSTVALAPTNPSNSRLNEAHQRRATNTPFVVQNSIPPQTERDTVQPNGTYPLPRLRCGTVPSPSPRCSSRIAPRMRRALASGRRRHPNRPDQRTNHKHATLQGPGETRLQHRRCITQQHLTLAPLCRPHKHTQPTIIGSNPSDGSRADAPSRQ